jgi:hypothetical protein
MSHSLEANPFLEHFRVWDSGKFSSRKLSLEVLDYDGLGLQGVMMIDPRGRNARRGRCGAA